MELIQKMKIGDDIARYRKEKKLTQVNLAKILRVLPTTISRWETGYAAPSLETLLKLSEILGRSFMIGK